MSETQVCAGFKRVGRFPNTCVAIQLLRLSRDFYISDQRRERERESVRERERVREGKIVSESNLSEAVIS